MAYVAIQATTIGARHQIDGLTRNIRVMKPAWNEVYAYMRVVMRRQFDTEGRYRGRGWAPITPDTIDRKRRGNYPYPERVGHQTGDMRRSFTTAGAKGNRSRVTDSGLVIASSISHTKYFDDKRNIYRVSPIDKAEIRKILHRWIMSGPFSL